MVTHVWISIQSDIGITMGELGSLSTETDSTLIASTLMALKDIVSIEASSGDSQFMTGAVESSSFGTFAIPINQQSQLVLSYIINADLGEIIDDAKVKLIQSLCIHLGKQLTQFSFISVFVTSGAHINRTVIIKAFINACTLVGMEYNLSSDDRSLRSGYKQVIDNLFTQKNQLLEAFTYILGENWQKDNEKWLSGLLILEEREKLIVGISEYIVYLLANDNPILLLSSPNPRNEQNIVLELLKDEINKRVANTHEVIAEILPEVIKNEMGRFLARLSIADMHRAHQLMFDQFVRESYLLAITNNPLTIFVAPDVNKIQNKFDEILPSANYEHIGTILQKSLAKTLNKQSSELIDSFYTSFIKELSDIKLSQSAMAFLVSFAQQFVTGKQLREDLQSQQQLKKSWIRDIAKYISAKSSMKSIKQLKVDSINEAVELTNAAGYSIVNTIAEILANQFLIVDGKIGFILDKIIEFYSSMGNLIKASSTIVTILENIALMKFNTDLVTPLYQDLIGAVIIRGDYSIQNEEHTYQLEKKKGLYYINSEQTSDLLVNFIHEKSKITLLATDEEKPLIINLMEIDVSILNKLITNADIIIEGVRFAVERRILRTVNQPFYDWQSEIEQTINTFILTIENDPIKIKSYIASEFSLPKLNYISNRLDERVDEIISVTIEESQQIWDVSKSQMKEIVTASTEKSLKKDAKKIQKLASNLLKAIVKISNEFEKSIAVLKKDIYDNIKSLKKRLKEGLDPKNGEILNFQSYNAETLLISREEVISNLTSLFQKYEEFKSNEFERLLLSISMIFFETPPAVLLDYAYNEVISGKLSNSVKLAINRVDTKENFEAILKSQANEFASNIFKGLSEIIARINQLYIARDGIVTTDGGKAALHMGRISLSKFPRKQLMHELLVFDEINFTRETNAWVISLQIADLEDFDSEEPTIVTFSDAVGYIHRTLFINEVGQIFDGLANIAAMIEPDAGKKVIKFYNNLVDTIFALF